GRAPDPPRCPRRRAAPALTAAVPVPVAAVPRRPAGAPAGPVRAATRSCPADPVRRSPEPLVVAGCPAVRRLPTAPAPAGWRTAPDGQQRAPPGRPAPLREPASGAPRPEIGRAHV